MTKSKTNTTEFKKLCDELFLLIGVEVQFDIIEDENDKSIKVNIKSERDSGLLIGNRGETLNSIQTILGLVYKQKFGEWVRILVDIADWRNKTEERLRSLASQTADRAKQSKEPQMLYNLTPSERRVVHLVLSEDKEIETESFGENKDRYLVVRPKK